MRLKDWREGEGMTRKDLAEQLNVHEQTVLRWEHGGRDADAGVKERVFLLSRGAVEPNDWYDLPAWRIKLGALLDRLMKRAA